MSIPKVSIIIPAYNCEKTISKSLLAVINQDMPGVKEVIVVDDGSSDKTAEKIKTFEKVNYIFQNNQGPAVARNHGARCAQGEYLCFTDSDCLPQKDWLEKILLPFKNETVAAVMGSYGIANPENLLAQCIQAEIIFRHQKLLPSHPKAFGSYNVTIRKDIFDALGGFNVHYRYASGEDNDLSYRILQKGYKIFFAKEAIVDHYHTESVIPYLKEQWRHGFWRVKLYLRHPRMTKGDDYTFWKDMLELPLSIIGTAVFIMMGLNFIPCAVILNLGLLILLHLLIELYYGLKIMGISGKGFLWALVMFLRSYTRTYGFIYGICHFLFLSILKRKNN